MTVSLRPLVSNSSHAAVSDARSYRRAPSRLRPLHPRTLANRFGMANDYEDDEDDIDVDDAAFPKLAVAPAGKATMGEV
jgi:hypothetical protein